MKEQWSMSQRLRVSDRLAELAQIPVDGSDMMTKHPEYRIVSRPNGLWCAQVRMAERGTMTKDNWEDIHYEMPKDDAMAIAVTWAVMGRKPGHDARESKK